jgi:hypothetical protein
LIEVGYRIEILPIHEIRASEHTDERAVQNLAQTVYAEGIWRTALPLEEQTRLVMDGNHRLKVAALMGFKRLPCVLLRYDDPRVTVRDWNSGKPLQWSDLFGMLQRHGVLPFKSTRHMFDPILPQVAVPFSVLR